MNTFFVGIAGGSGSGKTTLATRLRRYLGRRASIFHIDNYQKFEGRPPKLHGMDNWDHPDAVYWNKLVRDLKALKSGKTIKINHRDQNEFKQVKKMTFRPTPIIVVEGYLLFYKSAVRKLLDCLIFCSADDDVRINRRTKFKRAEYVDKILLPMHDKYIEPTKKYADLILHTGKSSVKEVVRKSLKHLLPQLTRF